MPSFDPATGAELLEGLTALAVAAAKAILDCRADHSVRIKADGSPVTPADEAAEAIIREGLARLAPSLPVVSEEQAERHAARRRCRLFPGRSARRHTRIHRRPRRVHRQYRA